MNRMKILILVCFCFIVWDNFLWMDRLVRKQTCSSWWSRWDSPAIVLGGVCGSTASVLFVTSPCWTFPNWLFAGLDGGGLVVVADDLWLVQLIFCFWSDHLAIIFWVASKIVWKISLYSTASSYRFICYLKKPVSFFNIHFVDAVVFRSIRWDFFSLLYQHFHIWHMENIYQLYEKNL